MNSQNFQFEANWWTTTENDQNCFLEHKANKEVITVNANYLSYAIHHFHRRLTSGDFIVTRYGNGGMTLKQTHNDQAEFKLEFRSCIFQSYGGLFSTTETRYISFRLADQDLD